MPESPPPTVAVVDDDADSLWLAAVVLTGAGLRVITDDGSTGLADRLARDPPDLILLDLHLEGRDADTALHEIRRQEKLRATPILGFTGALPGDPLLDRVGPALTGRVRKPLDPTELTAAVRRALGAAASPLRVASEPDPALSGLRLRFLHGVSDRIRRIEEARAAGERNALILEVHRLRGAAGNFGFAELAAAAEAAEVALRADSDEAPAAVTRLIVTARAM
jgi:two-component system sensor histidine kinase BarA